MTGRYDWNPMPHVVAVQCPQCGAEASFEFAEAVRIERRVDIPYFRGHSQFEYRFFEGRWAGTSYHAALYQQGLHGAPTRAIDATLLPAGYAPSDWAHGRYLYRSHGLDLGAVVCRSCGLRRPHELEWPADSYFQLGFQRHVLWAFHRESCAELRDYIDSGHRDRSRYRWGSFLLHVPSVFLAAKVRRRIVKQLDKMLGVAG
jgi:hypothetical protein